MKPPASKKTQLLRIDQAADALNCSRRTVYRLVETCEVDALKVRGALRITFDSLELYIRREISQFQEKNGVKTA